MNTQEQLIRAARTEEQVPSSQTELPKETIVPPRQVETPPEPQRSYYPPPNDIPFDPDSPINKNTSQPKGIFGLSLPSLGIIFVIAAFCAYIVLTFLGVQQANYKNDITRLEMDLVSMRQTDETLTTKNNDTEARISNALKSIESNTTLISETKSEIETLNSQVSSMESNIVSRLDTLSSDLTTKVDDKITEMENSIEEIIEEKEEEQEVASEPLEVTLKSLGDIIVPVGSTSLDAVYKIKLVNNMPNTKIEDIILTLYTQSQPMLLNIVNPTASGGFTTWQPVYSYGGMIFQNNWGLSLNGGETKTIMLAVHAEFDPVTAPTYFQAEIELEDYD